MKEKARSKKSQLSTNLKGFDYAIVDEKTQLFVKQRASIIKDLIRKTAQNMLEIGQTLQEVQAQLGYGKFRRWLNAEFNWSVSKATKLMQVAERFKSVNFTHLNFSTSALYVLAAPSTPETARQEALTLANRGMSITYSLAKNIVQQYKQSSLSQEDGLEQTVEVEAQVDKPANPLPGLPHDGKTLMLKQELQREGEMIYDVCQIEDPSTPISEQYFFKKCLQREWSCLLREKRFLSLIWCSIDNFGLFNPELSDLGKMNCLAKVLQVLKSNIKRPADLISYLGEEKFIIALPNTKPLGAKKVAEAIQVGIRQLQIPYPRLNHNSCVTVSLGLASIVPRLDLSLKMLVSAAEQGLIEAQQEGGNCLAISNLTIENLLTLEPT